MLTSISIKNKTSHPDFNWFLLKESLTFYQIQAKMIDY